MIDETLKGSRMKRVKPEDRGKALVYTAVEVWTSGAHNRAGEKTQETRTGQDDVCITDS